MGDKELNFEASGALKDASLVMRDRETDSWWSIMSSTAIGGNLNGADLVELPVGQKTTWKEWVTAHPDTLVLSVDGREHDPRSPYDDYFASSDTFRGLAARDDRLPPKEPIFSFHTADRAWAVPHKAIFGGRLISADEFGGRQLLIYRKPKVSMFASSTAYLVDDDVVQAASGDVTALLAQAAAGADGFEPVPGFDTFWYMWANVNEGSELLP